MVRSFGRVAPSLTGVESEPEAGLEEATGYILAGDQSHSDRGLVGECGATRPREVEVVGHAAAGEDVITRADILVGKLPDVFVAIGAATP